MFETAIPVLQVRRSVAAVEFYCRVLGFTLLYSWPSDDTQRDPRYLTLVRDWARCTSTHSRPLGWGRGSLRIC